MIRGLLLPAVMILSFSLAAQTDKIYFEFDLSKTATFPGGSRALYETLKPHLSYPEATLLRGAGGPTDLIFIVEPDGTISKLQIIGAPDTLCAAMLRETAQKYLSRWHPAEANGHGVRVLKCLQFYFHPHAGKVYFAGEAMPAFYPLHPIADFFALKPEARWKYTVRTGFQSLPTAKQALQIPEVVLKTGINAQVSIRLHVNQHGVLEKTEALNDPGYGMAEAAIAYGNQFKYWVPECRHDTCIGFSKDLQIHFRGDSAGLAADTRVFEETAHPAWRSKGVLDEVYISEADRLRLKKGSLKFSLIVEKDGSASAPVFSAPADSILQRYALQYLQEYKGRWAPHYFCDIKVRTGITRYLFYDPLTEQCYVLDRDPQQFPPPDLERVYRPEEVDVPPRHRFGDYALRNLYHEIWAYPAAARAAGIEGTVRMSVIIRPNGSVEASISQGLAGVCDRLALRIIREENFKFSPALKNGYPVPCRIEVELPFFMDK